MNFKIKNTPAKTGKDLIVKVKSMVKDTFFDEFGAALPKGIEEALSNIALRAYIQNEKRDNKFL